jgi:hypothetical protein
VEHSRNVAVIGGFEICYRARSGDWVFHVNLFMFGDGEEAIARFEDSFSSNEIFRPVTRYDLKDPAEQLSYILKFTTYHRPYEQKGPNKSKAVPLNPSEHLELVRWMDQYAFSDHVFLYNARRHGAAIELCSKVVRKA